MDGVPDGLQQTGRGGDQQVESKVSFLRTILGRGMFRGSRSKEDIEMQKRGIARSTNNSNNPPNNQAVEQNNQQVNQGGDDQQHVFRYIESRHLTYL